MDEQIQLIEERTGSRAKLRHAIAEYVAGNDIAFVVGKPLERATVLSFDVEDQLIDSLTEFTANAARKFLAGQLEHGGEIGDRDLDKEIDQEIYDLFHYHQANKRKNNAQHNI